MRSPRSSVLSVALLAAALLSRSASIAGSPAPAKRKPGPGTPAEPIELEKLDDPPSLYDARTNALARSPAPKIVVGPYQSIQVNVDSNHQNIVGDAANE